MVKVNFGLIVFIYENYIEKMFLKIKLLVYGMYCLDLFGE